MVLHGMAIIESQHHLSCFGRPGIGRPFSSTKAVNMIVNFMALSSLQAGWSGLVGTQGWIRQLIRSTVARDAGRPLAFGDILYSRPLTANYWARNDD